MSEITIYFQFESNTQEVFNGKEIYLDVDPTETFQSCIGKLGVKYAWFVHVKVQNYKLQSNNKEIDINKTLKELGIKNEDMIMVIANVKDTNKNEQNNENNQNLKSQDKIKINFKVVGEKHVNKSIDFKTQQFDGNQTLKEILASCYFSDDDNENKLRQQAASSNLIFLCNGDNIPEEERYKGICENDLDGTLEDYLKKNSLTGKDFTIHLYDPKAFGKDDKTKGKNVCLLIIGIILILLGLVALKFFAPGIALILVVAGLAFVALGLFWEKLPCCPGNSTSKICGEQKCDDDLNLLKYKGIDEYPRSKQNIDHLKQN